MKQNIFTKQIKMVYGIPSRRESERKGKAFWIKGRGGEIEDSI